jgi:hypothetical protein
MSKNMDWKHPKFVECFSGFPMKDATEQFQYVKTSQKIRTDGSYVFSVDGSIWVTDYNKLMKMEREGVKIRQLKHEELPKCRKRRNIMQICWRPIDICCGAAFAFDARVNYRAIPSMYAGSASTNCYSNLIKAAEIWTKLFSSRHHLTYYVADGQRAIEDALNSRGFHMAEEFYNRNSGNDIRIYAKSLKGVDYE